MNEMNVARDDQIEAATNEAQKEAQEASYAMASRGWTRSGISVDHYIPRAILRDLQAEQYRVCVHADRIAPAYSYLGWKTPVNMAETPRGNCEGGIWPILCDPDYIEHMNEYVKMLKIWPNSESLCSWCGQIQIGIDFFMAMFVLGFITFTGKICSDCIEEGSNA